MADTPKPAADASPEARRFEEVLAELDGLVRRLERGDLGLEESLAAFERGMQLVQQLAQRLVEVEERVEVLLRSEAGRLVLRPLDDE